MYTKESLINDFITLGVPQDKTVIVHASLRAVGQIRGGGEVLLAALIEHITKHGGRLLIPTHTWANVFEKKRIVLDITDPMTCIGALPNLAAVHPACCRTRHPTHSMAVFGKGKENYAALDEKSTTPASPDGCYGRIGKDGGYVLLLGVGQNKNTYLHAVEEEILGKARYQKTPTPMWIRTENGEEKLCLMHEFDESVVGDVSCRFPKFEPLFREAGAIREGTVGSASTQLCSAEKMREVMMLLYSYLNGQDPLADDMPLPALVTCNKERKQV